MRIKQKENIEEILEMPDLMEIQKKSYNEFLMIDMPIDKRKNQGLQEVFNSVFPVSDYNGKYTLQFVGYEFGKPKYTVDECIERGETYSASLKGIFRLIIKSEEDKTKVITDIPEQTVYLCEVPLMTHRGTFIINGAERVVVSQLHRAPGVSFEMETKEEGFAGFPSYSARIVPYRGTWLEIENDQKDLTYIVIDRKKKFLLTTFLRALRYDKNDKKKGTTEDILSLFFTDESLDVDDKHLLNRVISREVIDKDTGEILFEPMTLITKQVMDSLKKSKCEKNSCFDFG